MQRAAVQIMQQPKDLNALKERSAMHKTTVCFGEQCGVVIRRIDRSLHKVAFGAAARNNNHRPPLSRFAVAGNVKARTKAEPNKSLSHLSCITHTRARASARTKHH